MKMGAATIPCWTCGGDRSVDEELGRFLHRLNCRDRKVGDETVGLEQEKPLTLLSCSTKRRISADGSSDEFVRSLLRFAAHVYQL